MLLHRHCCLKEEEEGEDDLGSPSATESSYKDEDGSYSKTMHLKAVEKRNKKKWQSTWGPDCFRKSNHPLMTMVTVYSYVHVHPPCSHCVYLL